MITRVECARCSDVIELTSKSFVSLPFYCTSCETDAGEDIFMEDILGNSHVHEKLAELGMKVDEGAVSQFYENMSPTSECKSDRLAQPGLSTPHKHCACSDCRNPKKTFQADDVMERDATNALISDLEAQNTNLLNEITSLDNRIVALRADVKTAMKVVERLQDELVEEKDWNSELREDVSYWKGRVNYYLKRALKAEDHPWKNLWAYLWE